jgi:hypothetical protein
MALNVSKCAVSAINVPGLGPRTYTDLTIGGVCVPFLAAHEAYKYLGVMLRLDLNWESQFDYVYNQARERARRLAAHPASDVQAMQMASEAIKPALAYSAPLGIYKAAHLDKFATLLLRMAKDACGLHKSTRGAWAQLDRTRGGMGAVDMEEVATTEVANRLIADLSDEGGLGLQARGMLDALTDPSRFSKRKQTGGVYYHQLYQLARIAKCGLTLEGMGDKLMNGRFVDTFTTVKEIQFGLGFGTDCMEKYMPLWFEMGMTDPGCLVEPGLVHRAARFVSITDFQKRVEPYHRGATQTAQTKRPTQAQVRALKNLYHEYC